MEELLIGLCVDPDEMSKYFEPVLVVKMEKRPKNDAEFVLTKEQIEFSSIDVREFIGNMVHVNRFAGTEFQIEMKGDEIPTFFCASFF